jgi:hypothetical protein
MKGDNSLKVINTKGLNKGADDKNSLFGTAIRIKTLKDARRLLGKLIYEFQKGNIHNQDAKDLTYMLISYVAILKDSELEERLIALEEKTDMK